MNTPTTPKICEMREALHRMGYREEYLERISDERVRLLYESEYQS